MGGRRGISRRAGVTTGAKTGPPSSSYCVRVAERGCPRSGALAPSGPAESASVPAHRREDHEGESSRLAHVKRVPSPAMTAESESKVAAKIKNTEDKHS